LLSVVPEIHHSELVEQQILTGETPDPRAIPKGCRFHPRCPLAIDRCRREEPVLREVDGRLTACHRAEESLAGAVS